MIEKIKRLAKLGLESGRENSDILAVKPVSGGDINEAFYIKTKEAQFFMKYHPNAPKSFFQCEAMGLRLIKETNTIHVPNYLAYSDKAEEGFLLLEWIEGTKTKESEEILGQKLAQFHQATGRRHGLKVDTYIGLLKQPNSLEADWRKYYREKRLGNQLLIGVENGLIEGKRRQKLETLMNNLENWIPRIIAPSPLHGDLYRANWIAGPGGEPYLVDPSFLYGDRYFELAYTEMFGGMSDRFYEAYKEAFPIEENYEVLKPIYQLFYFLVHLNIFGETYGPPVDDILNRHV